MHTRGVAYPVENINIWILKSLRKILWIHLIGIKLRGPNQLPNVEHPARLRWRFEWNFISIVFSFFYFYSVIFLQREEEPSRNGYLGSDRK